MCWKVVISVLLLFGAACSNDTGTSPTPTPTPTSAEWSDLPGGRLTACESPDGYTVSMPETWSTNTGEVVPACSQFHPEPFEVPEGTDERVAAITAYIDPVPFATAATPDGTQNEDRAITAIDGRQALRLSYETGRGGFYPDGTRITTYIVDVQPRQGGPATLFVNTIGTEPFDYDTNVTILDRMATTLEITDPSVETDPAIIATYLGGGGGFSVAARAGDNEVCLRIPPNGEPVCADRPASDQVHTISLRDLGRDVQSGVAGGDVWRVDLVTHEGETHSYLPAAVPDTALGAYAFADTVEAFQRLILFSVTGAELRVIEPGQTQGPDPVT